MTAIAKIPPAGCDWLVGRMIGRPLCPERIRKPSIKENWHRLWAGTCWPESGCGC